MREDYNEKSTVQQSMVVTSRRFIERGVECHTAELQPHLRPLTIADFGSSTCANSSLAMSLIIEGLRAKYGFDATRAIQVVHNDLPGNDWPRAFQFIHADATSYLRQHKGVFAMASGLNFCQQILPPNTLNFGYSNFALHWLSKLPTKIKHHCMHQFGSEEEQEIFRSVSKQRESR